MRSKNSGNSKAQGSSGTRRPPQKRRLKLEKLIERRVFAAITGSVFEDTNHSFTRDASEAAAVARIIYVDGNDNGQLDVGEQLSIADSSGRFVLDNLADGTYTIRLFEGNNSQIQTTPIGSDGLGPRTDIALGQQIVADSDFLAVLTNNALVQPDLVGQSVSSISIADNVVQVQELPSGDFLAIGIDASGQVAWQIDVSDGTVTPVDVNENAPITPGTQLTSLAIDGTGFGLALETGTTDGVVRAIDASDPAGTGIQVTVTNTIVAPNSTAITSASGPRSVIASPTASGLDLSLWSNNTASFISANPITVPGVTELLAYDDATGLLALRRLGGGVSVHDVDANFAVLHEVTDPVGPVSIDADRDLLLIVSPVASTLSLFGLSDGDEVAELAIDLSSIGTPLAVSADRANDSVIILGSLGIAEMALDKPAATEVVIENDMDVTGLEFGVLLTGANTPPQYNDVPVFQTDEDVTLNRAAPALLDGSVDVEADDLLVIRTSDTPSGTVTTNIAGLLNYVPDLNFNGTDSFDVILHDGRDMSENVTIEITVSPIPDSPEGITINIPPVPEDLPVGEPVGIVDVIDGDGPGHTIIIDDERFIEEDGVIIFNGGALDFEIEPAIPLTITATDNETGEQVEETTVVTIRDRNDPITGILPEEAFVFENAPGDLIAELTVLDQDEEQFHSFTVDDSRFIVEETDLRLAPGVALDFETEPTVIINVTATEVGPGGTFTQAITLNVRNLPEQPQGLSLPNRTVTEFIPGDTVGQILIDGGTPEPQYEFTVDDDRFEFDGATLKLVDELFVSQDTEAQIQIEITATDTQNGFTPISETFVIDVLENQTPAHNLDNPFDVNHGGDVSASDALVIINYLNTFGSGPVLDGDLGFCYDVNADGYVTALDALLVVNQLNQISIGGTAGEGNGGEGEGEGEQIAPTAPVATPPLLQNAPQQRSVVSSREAIEAIDLIETDVVDEAILRDFAISQPRVFADDFVDIDASIDSLASQADRTVSLEELDSSIELLSGE